MMKIDDRDRQDILDGLQELAASYTPEWKFDTRQPDALSVIGLVFSHQMMENVRKLNQVWDKYHIAFANLYGLARKPAVPARTVCTLKVSGNVQGGAVLPAGTQVIGTADSGEEIVFAFTQDVCAVSAELTDIIETSEHFSLFPQQGRPFRRQAVVMRFKSFPNLQEQGAALRFRGNMTDQQMAELFADGDYFALSLVRDGQTMAFEPAVGSGGRIELVSSGAPAASPSGGEEMTVLVLEMRKLPAGRNGYCDIFINDIELLTACQSVRPDFIWNGREEAAEAQICPFTEQPSLYGECYIGQDFLFDRQESVVTLHFRLEFGRYRSRRAADSPPDLRIIRRKPRQREPVLHYECRVGEVSFSYFNGKGWRRLAADMDVAALFSREENAGEYRIGFVVPGDWERVVQGRYEGKCIRMQVVRADNCYLQEVEYIYPVLSDITLCMEEQARGIAPDSVSVVRGTGTDEVRDKLVDGSGFCAFAQAQYQGDWVYWGFDRPFGTNPVSLFVELERPAAELEVSYAYSDGRGFKPLKVVDQTDAFRNSGFLMFLPPSDLAEGEVDGTRRYWLRLQVSDRSGLPVRKPASAPVIRKVHLNAVPVENRIAREEQDYYIDRAAPDMRFPLCAENILSVQVWVNEKEQLAEERDRLMRDTPGEVRAEYNFLGEVEDFYVLWHEVDSFGQAAPMERCYCVDRDRNELVFGDGVHVGIPQGTDSIAFRTRVWCCDGEKANVRAGSIDRFRSTVTAVDQVVNPIDAYGGTDLEQMQSTLKRGGGILSARGRMVTAQDYVREAQAFSDMVAQAACVTKEDGTIRLVLLMRDYQKGDYSFRQIQQPLRDHLLGRCEAACGSAFLQVCLPVFVKVSVALWLDVPDLSGSIELRQRWLDRITAFLEPVDGQGEIRWPAGKLPGTRQIRLMLNALENTARIVHMKVLAQYSDGHAVCEKALDETAASPEMVCCNGLHRIYIAGDTYAQ